MKILVTGVLGQLGHDLVKELNRRGHTVIGIGSKEADITDADAVINKLNEWKPEAVMHCAAYTLVDNAEDDRERCDAVNRIGTENIARACAQIDAKLLYLSTDYVFSGDGDIPWKPDDTPRPLNIYGMTKYLGEEAVRRYTNKHFIVRTSWLFGINGRNFVNTMLRLSAERDILTVVSDQVGSPTYTVDLSRLLSDMIESEKYGTYHAANEGFCSWYEFACAIMEKTGRFAKVVPVLSTDYPAKARRPSNSRMNKDKLSERGFSRLPHWEDALERYLCEMENRNNE